MTTDRVLQLVLERASLDRRLELATMDGELCQQVLAFPDVSLAIIKPDNVILATKKIQLAAAPISVEKMRLHFKDLPKVVVETKISTEDWQRLLRLKLKKLYVVLENLDEIAKLPAGINHHLKSLHLLQSCRMALDVNAFLPKKKLQSLLAPSLTRIRLTGLILPKETIECLFAMPNLISMDLLGTVVDSGEAKSLQDTLKPPKSLEELSLPSSWFSFSKACSYNDKNFKKTYNFAKWMSHVPKLCLYIQVYSEQTFWSFLEESMPTHLEVLVLYGDCAALERSTKVKEWTKFTILFGPKDCQLLCFPNGESTVLLSHIVKKPPYSWTRPKLSDWRVKLIDRSKEKAKSKMAVNRTGGGRPMSTTTSRSGSRTSSRSTGGRSGRGGRRWHDRNRSGSRSGTQNSQQRTGSSRNRPRNHPAAQPRQTQPGFN